MSDKKTEKTKVPMSKKTKVILVLAGASLVVTGMLINYKKTRDDVFQSSYEREREYIERHGGRRF